MTADHGAAPQGSDTSGGSGRDKAAETSVSLPAPCWASLKGVFTPLPPVSTALCAPRGRCLSAGAVRRAGLGGWGTAPHGWALREKGGVAVGGEARKVLRVAECLVGRCLVAWLPLKGQQLRHRGRRGMGSRTLVRRVLVEGRVWGQDRFGAPGAQVRACRLFAGLPALPAMYWGHLGAFTAADWGLGPSPTLLTVASGPGALGRGSSSCRRPAIPCSHVPCPCRGLLPVFSCAPPPAGGGRPPG